MVVLVLTSIYSTSRTFGCPVLCLPDKYDAAFEPFVSHVTTLVVLPIPAVMLMLRVCYVLVGYSHIVCPNCFTVCVAVSLTGATGLLYWPRSIPVSWPFWSLLG